MAKTIHSAVGIDISSSSLNLLQLKKQIDSVSIYASSRVPLSDEQDEGMILSKLKELLAGTKLKGKEAIVALPSHLITTIPLKFTLREGEDMNQAIFREAGNYLPFSVESALIDYLNITSFDQRQKSILLMAAKREDIIRYINLLRQVGLEALAIEPKFCSLFRTIQWVFEDDLKDQFVFHIGESDSLIMVIVNKQIIIVRQIPWGVRLVKSKMEKALGLPGERVERVLQQYGVEIGQENNPGTARINFLDVRELYQIMYEIISPILEELCQEIQRVLSYCASIIQQRVIDKALLLGQGSRIKSLSDFVQRKTGLKVTSWETLAKAKLLMEKQPFFEVALGLALRDEKCLK